MIFPSRSQFDSALTKTSLAEIFKCRKIRTTGALLRIRSSREAAAARQPDRMGQRHSLRPVRPRSRPGPLATGPYVVFLQQSGRYPCQRFIPNQVRLALFVLAYNLGNFLRRLVLPGRIKHWSLRSLLTKLIKIGAKVVRHGRIVTFQMAEVAVSKEIWAEMLSRIDRLRWLTAWHERFLIKRLERRLHGSDF